MIRSAFWISHRQSTSLFVLDVYLRALSVHFLKWHHSSMEFLGGVRSKTSTTQISDAFAGDDPLSFGTLIVSFIVVHTTRIS